MERESEMLWEPRRAPAHRLTVWWVIGTLAANAALIAAISLGWAGVIPRRAWYFGAFLVAAGLMGSVGYVAARESRRILQKHGWLLCLRCCYPLDERVSRCPECGQAFDARQVRRIWELNYGAPNPRSIVKK